MNLENKILLFNDLLMPMHVLIYLDIYLIWFLNKWINFIVVDVDQISIGIFRVQIGVVDCDAKKVRNSFSIR